MDDSPTARYGRHVEDAGVHHNLAWFMQSLVGLGVKAKVWLATDGAYATRPFLLPVLKMGIVVVSRLRKDACLFDLPGPDAHGNRIYGKNKLSLAKRAGHQEGWQSITYPCRGVEVTHEVRDILESYGARWAIEEHFHDIKEVWGAGQQQVRNVWSNIGCWHLNQWVFTLVELCC